MKYDILYKKLLCPVCKTPLALSENKKSLLCCCDVFFNKENAKKHCFDISSSGYVNLITGHSAGGDSKECVKSRSLFLSTGHYKKISEAIASISDKYFKEGSVLLDAGCGEGYYTNNLAKHRKDCFISGIDLSRFAIERASKSAAAQSLTNTFFAVAGIFDLPFADESIDGIINLFAPCAEIEFCRILKKNGILIACGAGENHLFGFKKAIYDSPYKNEVRADLPLKMELLENQKISYEIFLKNKDEIMNLFAMTPYYYRTSEADRNKLASLESLKTEIEVEISVYKKKD